MQQRLMEIFAEIFPNDKGEKTREYLVLPLLQRVQREFGYIPSESIRPIARFARVPESHVYGVATFYAQFKLKPIGKNIITVCRGTACHVKRSASLLDDLRQHLQIEPGETTPDMKFTIQTVACIGSCALAPAVVVNGKVYGQVSRTRLLKMIDKLAAEADDDRAAVAAGVGK